MSDVFRFVTARPVQLARAPELARTVIRGFGPPGGESEFHLELNTLAAVGADADLRAAAQAFVASRLVSDLAELEIPLAELDKFLELSGDRVEPRSIAEKLRVSSVRPVEGQEDEGEKERDGEKKQRGEKKRDEGEVDRLAVKALISSRAYQLDRERVADSLMAVALTDSDEETRDRLMRAISLFGLIEKLAEAEAAIDHADDVLRLLADSIVVLPADVFTTLGEDAVLPAAANQSEAASAEVALPAVPAETQFVEARENGHPAGAGSVAAYNALPFGAEPAQQARVETIPPPDMVESEAATSAETETALVSAPTQVPVETAASVALQLGFSPGPWRPASVLARKAGFADLMVVQQALVRYEPGEVAHIENVLLGESKERVHKRATTTEEVATFELETTKETEQDLHSTDRFELQQEAAQTLREDSQVQAGVEATATWGPVTVSGSLGYASNYAREESSRTASTFAHDVTQRTLSRLQERTREARTRRTTETVEETNKHGVDNVGGTGHVVGVYRWLDKVYRAQVVNYGKRLLLELVIPEPAAFYRYANRKRPSGVTVEKPPAPKVKGRDLAPSDLNDKTYLDWVRTYKVADVKPPPVYERHVALAWEEQAQDKVRRIFRARKEVQIPEGYMAVKFKASILTLQESIVVGTAPPVTGGAGATISQAPVSRAQVDMAVGPHFMRHLPTSETGALSWAMDLASGGRDIGSLPLEPIVGELPVALAVSNAYGFAVTVDVVCRRMSEAYVSWQLRTYEAIMRAYYELKSAYDEAVAAVETRRGVEITGRNPLENRSVERTELKRAAISMLAREELRTFDAIRDAGPDKFPEIDLSISRRLGRSTEFFEQAFEWPQLTYLFYPYFWGTRSEWAADLHIDDPDPLFAEFLRAGAARVIIPVRRNFEKAIAWYLATGKIWQGGRVPAIGDPLYISIAQEIRSQEPFNHGKPVGAAWEVRVPTSLVMLQKDATLQPATQP